MIKTSEKALQAQRAYYARHKVGLAPAVLSWAKREAQARAKARIREERLPDLPGLRLDLMEDEMSSLTRDFPRHWNAFEADQARLIALRNLLREDSQRLKAQA